MKYVLFFALFVAIAQIDTLMKLFDKASVGVTRQKDRLTQPATTTDIRTENDVVTVSDDPTLKINPHDRVIALMESYRLSPEPEVRLKIMEDIKVVPKMLTPALDRQMEAAVYGWRDLLLNQHEDTLTFLVSLENLLQGENQLMIRKLFSVLFDQNPEAFIKVYQKTKDVNCKAVTYFADVVPDEEKMNEYREREDALAEFLKKENLDEGAKKFAGICQMFLRAAMTTPAAAEAAPTTTPAPAATSTPAPTPTPTPTPAPEATSGQPIITVPINP